MELSVRSMGWLRTLDRTVGDAGRATPDEAGGPDAAAGATAEGTVALTLACGLLARRTPAWTEPTLRLLDAVIAGHTARWPAEADPGRLAARPDTAALLVALGGRALLSPADRWNEPFELAGDGRTAATHTELAAAAATAAIAARGKPGAPSTATLALGLWLHDRRHGSALYEPFARDHLDPDAAGPHPAVPGPADALAGAVLLALTAPDFIRAALGAVVSIMQDDQPAELAGALLLARELDDAPTAERLADLLGRHVEPQPDATTGAFTARPGAAPLPPAALALLAAADTAAPGGLAASLSGAVPPQPQLLDVDFPAFGLRRAEWQRGFLHLRFDPLVEDRAARTTFRLVGAEPRVWWVSGADGVTIDLSVAEATVRAPMVRAAVELAPSSY